GPVVQPAACQPADFPNDVASWGVLLGSSGTAGAPKPVDHGAVGVVAQDGCRVVNAVRWPPDGASVHTISAAGKAPTALPQAQARNRTQGGQRNALARSEERRVGKECRSRVVRDH